jgi:hypothetical protein
LTIVWLLLQRANGQAFKAASAQDYKRNAELRDQFNASRLSIGMTKSKVESVLRAKPIALANRGDTTFELFGSRESFNIVGSLHFSNILVVLRDGKVTGLYSGESAPGGEQGMRAMREWFRGMPTEHEEQ